MPCPHARALAVADSSNFEQQLESGYLLGELLDRYELQTDFSRFRNEESSEAKLNNFKRLFPTFKLLQVPFDANTAQEVMAGKKGCANRLAYQLHTALNNVKRAGLSLGQQQVDTRKVRRNVVDERMYNDQLTRQVQRQTNLDQRELEETAELDRTVREDRWRSESLKEEAQMETIRAQNIKAAMERSKEVKRMRDERAKQIETMMAAKVRCCCACSLCVYVCVCVFLSFSRLFYLYLSVFFLPPRNLPPSLPPPPHRPHPPPRS